MVAFEEALREFYSGEVLGEAVYSAMLGVAQNADERFKLETLLQLETETKAWLRPTMVAYGVSLVEDPADRKKGVTAAAAFQAASWAQKMQGVHDVIADQFVPLYQGFANSARERGRADQEAVCLFMVEHEKAQVEFARLELAGAGMDQSLAPIVKFLKVPLKPSTVPR